MTEAAIETTEGEEFRQLTTTVSAWPEKAKSAQVTSAASYKRAADLLLEIKDLRAEIDATFGPIVRKANDAHKEALAQRKRHEAPLQEAERLLKTRMGSWQQIEDQRQREREAQIAAEARRRDEEARLREAEALEQAGETEQAELVLEEPAPLPPPRAPSRVPKVGGVATREIWKAEVIDLMAMVKAIAAGHVPLAAVEPNQKVIGQQARSLKGELQWPGVRVWPEQSIAAGRR